MTRILFGTILMASLVMSLRASEQPILPIGYFVETVTSEDEDTPQVHAKFIRDGETYDAAQGMEVYPGDKILTQAGGGIAVLFLNSSIVELDENTHLSVIGGGGSAKDVTNLTVNQGHVGVVTTSVLNGMNIGMGDAHTPYARATTVKPAKLDIIVLPAGTGYNTTVYCTQGTAVLTPIVGSVANDVSITSGTQALLSVIAPVTGVTTTPVTVVTTPTTKADLKAAQGNLKLATSGTEMKVSVGKTSVSIKTTIKNTDGSTITGSITTNVAGMVTKDSWKTSNKATKYSQSWSESTSSKGVKTISVKANFTGNTFSAKFSNGVAPKCTLKLGKVTYNGSATYDPATGKYVFNGVTKTLTSSVVYTYDPKADGGATGTAVTNTGGVVGTFILTQPVPPPSGFTPDGRLIGQNGPPVSQ